MLRAIVVGAGYMGRNHIRILRSFLDVDLVGVVEPDKFTGKNVARMYRLPIFESLDNCLQSTKPDFVIIASPTSTHYYLAKKCLSAQIPTFVEKPIAKTINQGKKLIDISRRTKTPLTVGHIERFNPAVVELKRRLTQKQIGKIYEIRADRRGPFPGRISDVGVVIDLATHDIDMFEFLLKKKITHVTARIRRYFHPGHEDYLVCLADFDDGATGVLNINWITPTKVRLLQVSGERGMFVVNYLTQELFLYKNNTSKIKWEQMEVYKAVSEGDMIKIKIDYEEPLSVELRAFINAMINKRTMPVDPQSALRALTIAQLALRSESQGNGVIINQ